MNSLVASFLRRYKYKANPLPFIFGWRFVDEYEKAEGACVDFAWTVAWLDATSLLKLLWGVLTFKYIFVWSYSKNNTVVPRHCLLYVRGQGWIDSTHRYYRPWYNPIHVPLLPLPFFWVYFRGAWGGLV